MPWSSVAPAPILPPSSMIASACNVPLWIEEDQGGPDAVLDDIDARLSRLHNEAEEAPRAAQARDQAEVAPAPLTEPGI